MKSIYSWLRAGLFTGILLSSGLRVRAQTPVWQNVIASTVSANSDAYVVGMTADAAGNVYLVGAFSGTASFGTTTLTSAGQEDGFVAKWNAGANDFTWAQRLGGAYGDGARAVAVSGTSVYVTGGFRSLAATFGSVTLTSAGVEDLFVTKLVDIGPTASFVWAQRVGSSLSEAGEAVAVSGNNVYVAGYYTDATFGPTTLPTGSATNLFVAKMVDAGPTSAFVWAKAAGGFGFNSVHALALNGPNVYLAGFFSGTATFGATTLTSAGSYDAVVAKLVDAGATADFAWAQRAGGSGEDRARGIALSGTSVYVAGSFEGSATAFGSTTLASAGQADAFVAKLTDAGLASNFGWAVRMGGADADRAYALAGAGTGMCVVGEFAGRAATFGTTTLAAASTYGTDLFVARLTDAGPTGRVGWVQRAGGSASTSCSAVTIAPGGTVYVGAGVQPPAAFGTWQVSGLTGTTVAALASLTDLTLTATTAALAGAEFGVFPNPAHGTVTVQQPPLSGTTAATLTLLDALGRAVRARNVSLSPAGLRHDLNLTGLAPGLYALRVEAGAATATRRLVVE